MRYRFAQGIAVGSAGLGVLGLLPGASYGASADLKCPAGSISAEELPRTPEACDLTGLLVRTRIGQLQVPTRGAGVGADRIDSRGRSKTAILEHGEDGSVTISYGPPNAFSSERYDSGCRDSAFAVDGHRFASRYAWFFNSGGVAQVAAKRAAITRGLQDVVKRRSPCSVTNALPGRAQPVYKGQTVSKPGISASGGCSADGASVVGFGSLSGYWGYACWWWRTGKITIEADVLLNKSLNWWTGASIAGCSNRPDLEGLAAHEFGHVYGLLHVDEGRYPDQTMSTYINGTCSVLERTLGKGDLAGLKDLYGN